MLPTLAALKEVGFVFGHCFRCLRSVSLLAADSCLPIVDFHNIRFPLDFPLGWIKFAAQRLFLLLEKLFCLLAPQISVCQSDCIF